MRAPDHAPSPHIDWKLVGGWIAVLLIAGIVANAAASLAAAWS